MGLPVQAPTLRILSPSSALAGDEDFTLRVRGDGFTQSSVVQWDGTELSTQFVNDTLLQSTVPAARVATAGTSQVTVLSSSGGAESAPDTFCVAPAPSGSRFVWPVDCAGDPTQPYAYFGYIPGKFHTGLDLTQSTSGPYGYTAPVRAAWPGWVVKIYGLGQNVVPVENNLRRWDPFTDDYRWEAAQIYEGNPNGNDRSNHGLGISVIIYHPDLQLYTLYGHLDAVIEGLQPDSWVEAGDVIGRMGNSYQQFLRWCPKEDQPQRACEGDARITVDDEGFKPHLHFEVKDRGVLSAQTTDHGEMLDWGYTKGSESDSMPGHPNWFGFHNPRIFLDFNVQKLSIPVPVQILPVEPLSTSLNVRDYPGTSDSRVITGISRRPDDARPAFVAVRSIGSEWYQIYLPNNGVVDEPGPREGWSASGWIAGSFDGTQYSEENPALPQFVVTRDSVRVREDANSASQTLVFVYGENPLDPQRFVPFESKSDGTKLWHRVYLPDKSSKADGWISSSDGEVIGETMPDLTVSADVDVSYTAAASNVPIAVTVHRSAGVLTQGTHVTARLYWSTNTAWEPAVDLELWESDADPPDFPNTVLNDQGSRTVTATINVPALEEGAYYLLAIVDPTEFHPESNEQNNVAVYPVTLTSGPSTATQLAFTAQPGDVLAPRNVFPTGFRIWPAVEVEVQDAEGNPVPSYGTSICLELGTNPAGGTLSGGGCVVPVDGVAAYPNLVIDERGVGYSLVATSGSLATAESDPFNITEPGDLDLDDLVDQIDLDLLLASWSDTSHPPADINKDGTVDVVDLSILLSHWSAPSVTTDSATAITSSTATLFGTVNPNGDATDAWFEWGVDPGLEIFNSSSVQAVGSGTSDQDVSAGLTDLTSNRTYYFRVRAVSGGGLARGEIRSFTTGPGGDEGGPITVGDTIYGSIEPTGDIDEFTFSGTAGQEVAAFLQTLSGGYFDNLRLCLVADAGTYDELEVGCVSSNGDDTSLWGQGTGLLELPRSTTYTARVQGIYGDTGPYRFQVYPIDRAPEVRAQALVLNDTIEGESIEPLGDIDEFTFAGTEGQEVAAFLQTLTGGYLNDLRVCLLADAGTFDELQLGCAGSNGDDLSLWGQSTGRFALPRTTTYTVRVMGGQSAYDWGPYRVMAYLVDRAPEARAQALVLNDTIDGESIGPPGDIDEFTFAGTAGQEVAAFLRTLTGGYLNDLRVCLLADAGTFDELQLGCASSNGDDLTLWGQSTGRFALPRTTTYTVRVMGGQSASDWGPYRVMAYLVDRPPEVRAQALVLNDTIDGESIEPPGDIDEFTFAGTEGQEVAAFLRTLTGGYLNDLRLCLLADAGTFDELQLGCASSNGDDLSLWGQSTGRFTLPRTTTYTVRVMGGQSASDWGPYRLMGYLVNRAPEDVDESVAVGDTIAGESIEPPGDIDEFTFSGTTGEVIEVFFQALSGGYFERLELNLLANAGTASEQRLGSRVISDGADTSLEGQSTGQVTLPHTGTFTVRVVGLDSRWGVGAYRFHVRQ
jgi:murein DD-endopeptidase MepM/ murein hydrolase activator NlpD